MQAVQRLVERHMSQLKRLLANALDSKKILTEVSSGPSGLLQGGGRSVAASARVQVWQQCLHCFSHFNVMPLVVQCLIILDLTPKIVRLFSSVHRQS